MIVFKTASELQKYLDAQKKSKASIGFIPTMGALHKGHISLVNIAKEQGNITVCSIFINPAQFNDKTDFEKYPNTVAEDIILLESAGCDILFLPSVKEIYPSGSEMATAYQFGKLETVLEGAQRPGHFNGVGKVVGILLEIVQPDFLYMGNKDYQQCLIVKELIRQMKLDDKITFVACPTQREPDGLAMSSRNRRLSEGQRSLAGIIYQCLVSIQSKFLSGARFSIIEKECLELMKAKGFETEYVRLAEAETLKDLSEFDASKKMVALIATKIGTIRLIDNLILN